MKRVQSNFDFEKKLVLCCSQPHHLDNQDFHKKKRKVKSNAPKLRLTSFEPADQFTCWFLFFKNLTRCKSESKKVSKFSIIHVRLNSTLSARVIITANSSQLAGSLNSKICKWCFFFRNRRVAISYVRADRWSWGHTKSFEWMTRQVHTLDKLR